MRAGLEVLTGRSYFRRRMMVPQEGWLEYDRKPGLLRVPGRHPARLANCLGRPRYGNNG
jgi:hypothetical protein